MFDGGGLYLEIAPAGGKWWRLKYRFGGKEKRQEKRLSLGVHPDVPLKEARERHSEARRLLANEIDPSEHRKANKAATADRAANSFETIAREWFSKHRPSWVASHADRIIRRLERDIFPWIGGRPIADITAPQLLEVIRRIEELWCFGDRVGSKNSCGLPMVVLEQSAQPLTTADRSLRAGH